jgi:hypothetical protein
MQDRSVSSISRADEVFRDPDSPVGRIGRQFRVAVFTP